MANAELGWAATSEVSSACPFSTTVGGTAPKRRGEQGTHRVKAHDYDQGVRLAFVQDAQRLVELARLVDDAEPENAI